MYRLLIVENDNGNIIRCLYEGRVCGRISVERYDAMAVGYETEQAERKQELVSITEKIEEMDMRELCIRRHDFSVKDSREMLAIVFIGELYFCRL